MDICAGWVPWRDRVLAFPWTAPRREGPSVPAVLVQPIYEYCTPLARSEVAVQNRQYAPRGPSGALLNAVLGRIASVGLIPPIAAHHHHEIVQKVPEGRNECRDIRQRRRIQYAVHRLGFALGSDQS